MENEILINGKPCDWNGIKYIIEKPRFGKMNLFYTSIANKLKEGKTVGFLGLKDPDRTLNDLKERGIKAIAKPILKKNQHQGWVFSYHPEH